MSSTATVTLQTRRITSTDINASSVPIVDGLTASRNSEQHSQSVDDDITACSVEPFSLLLCDVVDDIAARLDISTQTILDAWPVTFTQAIAVEDALQRPPRQWSHFYLDLPDDFDTHEATKLCETLWSHIEDLRAVFVHCQEQYFQVKLAGLRPNITQCSSATDSVQELSKTAFERDSQSPGVLGDPFCAFFVFSGIEGRTRIGIRLSRAQYDSTSLLLMLRCIAAAHTKQRLPAIGPFSAYRKHALDTEAAARTYWRQLLTDSRLTTLATTHDQYAASSLISVRKTVAMSPATEYDATIRFTAACANFLARLSKCEDVTFGRVVSGRDVLNGQMRNTFGSCGNVIPVHVKVGNDESILRSVQDQHSNGKAHAALGFDVLAKSCSEWPSNSRGFGCVVHFQELEDAQEEFDGTLKTLKCYRPTKLRDIPHADVLHIVGTPVGDRKLWLELNANSSFYTEEMLAGWAESLAAMIEQLADCKSFS